MAPAYPRIVGQQEAHGVFEHTDRPIPGVVGKRLGIKFPVCRQRYCQFGPLEVLVGQIVGHIHDMRPHAHGHQCVATVVIGRWDDADVYREPVGARPQEHTVILAQKALDVLSYGLGFFAGVTLVGRCCRLSAGGCAVSRTAGCVGLPAIVAAAFLRLRQTVYFPILAKIGKVELASGIPTEQSLKFVKAGFHIEDNQVDVTIVAPHGSAYHTPQPLGGKHVVFYHVFKVVAEAESLIGRIVAAIRSSRKCDEGCMCPETVQAVEDARRT